MNKVNDCNISVTIALPFPSIKDPRITRKNPKNSANQPNMEMWILIRWRRCRISLEESDSGDQYSLEGYTKSLQKKGMGKGIGTYVRKEKVELGESVSEIRFQINQTIHVSVDIIGIYRSQGGSAQEVLNQLVTLIDEGRDTLVVGDFNICYRENINNRLIQGLLNMQFRQLVYEPTHIRGRIIDHVYFRSGENLVLPTVERYSPYYSDHDALCINLKLKKDCYEDTD